ncbi:MAG: hypothetical protein AVDCRST_MAG93-4503 [uncultured Chloroflexia bacterium]|uniref:Restriction endonuclease type IV Mrr domain-containing protein n=1 Tax=uncultured Chloroflexia bacterium TaxID=1672391 RepID=A0A6J4K9X9_9CHLR|nr:MAG: hypothetical protein AVDCRST_MAG93-4503 [uncultured Chloroflexia bacterium]
MRAADYEDALLQHLHHQFSNHLFSVAGTEDGRQHKIYGRYSRVLRQIDAAVYCRGKSSPILMADAKRYRKPIDVKDVECFIGMVNDVGADIGLLVAPRPFTPAAQRRAQAADMVLKIMTIDEATNYRWLPLARQLYPWDWAYHNDLALALRRILEKVDIGLVIEALGDVPFEEWEAYVRYALSYHREEAVSLLETVAQAHYYSGWRFNAIRLLQEAELLRSEFREQLEQHEEDPETLLLLRGEL